MSSERIKVVTKKARSSYMYVNKLEQRGKKITPDTAKTCRTTILIPNSDKATLNAIHAAIEAASNKSFSKVIVKPGKDGYPLRNANEEIDDETLDEELHEIYRDHHFFSATSYKIPGLVDKEGSRIDDPDEREEVCVSGNYFNFSVTFKGYDNESRGVRAILNNMRFLEEGERLDGGVSAENEDWDSDEEEETPRSKRSSRRSQR